MVLENYAVGLRGFPDTTITAAASSGAAAIERKGSLNVLVAGYDAPVIEAIKKYLDGREEEFILYSDSKTGGEGVKQALEGTHTGLEGRVHFDIAVVSPAVKWQSLNGNGFDYDGHALLLVLEQQHGGRPATIWYNPSQQQAAKEPFVRSIMSVRHGYGHGNPRADHKANPENLTEVLGTAIDQYLTSPTQRHQQETPKNGKGEFYQLPRQQSQEQDVRHAALEVHL